MNNARMILVNSTECTNGCPGCYYGSREPISTGEFPLHHIALTYPRIAIGLNSIGYEDDLELARKVVNVGGDLILTTCMNDEVIMAIPNEVMDACTLALSWREGSTLEEDTIHRIRRSSGVCTVAALHTHLAAQGMLREVVDLYNAVGSHIVYLLMEKGPPDHGWRMEHHGPRYTQVFADLVNMHGPSIRPDECVVGVGNCISKEWIEIDSAGQVRSCPYSSEPDIIIDRVEELDRYSPPTIVMCKEDM